MSLMRDPGWDRLLRGILDDMQRLIDRAIGPWTKGGKLDLGSPNVTGVLPGKAGGTGTTSGGYSVAQDEGAALPQRRATSYEGKALQALDDIPGARTRVVSTAPVNPMTALGDLIYGAALTHTNQATAGQGATASADSTFSTFVPARAIDGDDATTWCSLNPVANRWLAVDLGQARAVAAFRVAQIDLGADGATQYKLQRSSDGALWTDVQTVNSVLDTGVLAVVGAPLGYRHWRVLAVVGGGNGWQIKTFALYTVATDAGDALALHVGADNDQLALVAGKPAWLAGGLYNVRAYGAAGDGATDDTAAIQAAIDAAKLVNGTVVLPPVAARYRLTRALLIDAPLAVLCYGKGSTLRQDAWGVPALEIRSADVRILGECYAEYVGARTLFDGAALTASVNSATVKTECAGDPKSAGSAIYCRVDYDRLYVQRARVKGFIAGVLLGTQSERDVRLDSVAVETVDFGVWGNPANTAIGAVQARDITRTQGVDEHAVYWTQTGTRNVGCTIASVEVDGIATPGAHAVSVKSVDDFWIGAIVARNVGSLFNAIEASGTVGSLHARAMVALPAADNGAVVLAQSNSFVTVSACDIEANVAGTDATTKSRVFDCTTTSKLVVHSPHVRLVHATPGPAFRCSALAWYLDAVIEVDNAFPAGLAAFVVSGVRAALVCQYVVRPFLRGSDQLLRCEAAADAYDLLCDPNLVNNGVPGATTIVSGTANHHTRFVAELEAPQVIAAGTTQPQIRGANVFITANAGATAITKFLSGTNGQRFCVIAGDAFTTINDNVDIKTKGNAAHLLALGEVVWFQYLQGAAYELQSTV